jgi:hypothetical protein
LVFASAGEAIAAAVALQRTLRGAGRVAIHTGDVEFEKGCHRGAGLAVVARLLEASHPGQILCSEATVSVVGPAMVPAPEWIDLGCYRLRGAGLDRSLHLYQLPYRGMPAAALQRPRAEAAHAGNLPRSLTLFIGREAQVEQLLAMLAPRALRAESRGLRVPEDPDPQPSSLSKPLRG